MSEQQPYYGDRNMDAIHSGSEGRESFLRGFVQELLEEEEAVLAEKLAKVLRLRGYHVSKGTMNTRDIACPSCWAAPGVKCELRRRGGDAYVDVDGHLEHALRFHRRPASADAGDPRYWIRR